MLLGKDLYGFFFYFIFEEMSGVHAENSWWILMLQCVITALFFLLLQASQLCQTQVCDSSKQMEFVRACSSV